MYIVKKKFRLKFPFFNQAALFSLNVLENLYQIFLTFAFSYTVNLVEPEYSLYSG